jgi:hypothetical protein
MITAEVNGETSRGTYRQDAAEEKYEIRVHDLSRGPQRLELVQEGRVIAKASTSGPVPASGAFPLELTAPVRVASSTWLAARCFETLADGRERFAHSAPIFIDVEGKPLRPRRPEIEYLISRVKSEIERNAGVLSDEALAEFRAALESYQAIAQPAR